MIGKVLKKLKFTVFYINFYRLLFYFVLANILFINSPNNMFICSYIIYLSSIFKLTTIFNSFYGFFIVYYLFKTSYYATNNVLNKFIINEFLIVKLLTMQTTKSIIAFELKYGYHYIITFFKFMYFFINYKSITHFVSALLSLFRRQYNWFPLFKKISYFGFYRSFRSYNGLDYEKSICNTKK